MTIGWADKDMDIFEWVRNFYMGRTSVRENLKNKCICHRLGDMLKARNITHTEKG